MKFYSPQEVYDNKMLVSEPSLPKIYYLLRYGQLTHIDNGTTKKAEYCIRQSDIDDYNERYEQGRLRRRIMPERKQVHPKRKCVA